MLFNWDGFGWCPGSIQEANGDKSETVDGAVVNFKVYYDIDSDLASHVLGLDTYKADGPVNSWVLLEATRALPNPNL